MAEIDGIWDVTIKVPTGEQSGILTLAMSGGNLTGTFADANRQTEIFDGTVEGDQIGFSIKVTTPIPLTLTPELTLAGDTLNGSVKAGAFGKFPMTALRR